jgi:hypothetical protein
VRRSLSPAKAPTLRHAHAFLLLALGAALGLVGAVAPWVPHPAAGLSVGGFDLFETTKFLPAVRCGAVSLLREAFLLPLLASAVLLALAPAFVGGTFRAARWLFPGVAAAITLAAFPAYPGILVAHRDPEYRGQLLLTAGAFLLALLSPLARRLPARVRDGLVAALALGGLAPALVALARVRPLFAALYDTPVGVGWGAVVYGLGCAIALAAALPSKR